MLFFVKVKARVGLPLSLFLFCLFAISCSKKPLTQVEAYGQTMGTTYSVKVVLHPGEPALQSDQLKEIADEVFARVNQQMSTYIEDSELSLWNQDASGDWITPSAPLYGLISTSLDISHRSEGYFDVTVMPLVNLWGFGPQDRREPPSDEAIKEAKTHVGFQQIELNSNSKSARKPVGVTVDLSAIAKGFGGDELAERLRAEGFANFMVEVGGELVLHGQNAHSKPWRIGVETPSYNPLAGREQPAAAVDVSDVGMATSGDYRNYYEVDGQRVSHTIDPVTGRPITHNLASVTVIAPTCAVADGWATALNVMGPDKAMEIAEKEGLAAYLLVKRGDGFEAQMSSAFEPYLHK